MRLCSERTPTVMHEEPYFSDIEAMTVNGVRIRLEALKDGVFTGEVAPSAMSKGVNKVAVCAAAAVTLHDFSLSVAVTR